MLDGWYCRSMANNAANNDEESAEDEESQDEEVINYREQYKQLKRKLKYLIYENESFRDALRSAQKRLLIATQDRSFLLDRLLLYERVENSSSESEDTDSSDDTDVNRVDIKRRRLDAGNSVHQTNQTVSAGKSSSAKKKKPNVPKIVQKQSVPEPTPSAQHASSSLASTTSDGHMTPEEVERHLQSRQTFMELLPERAPPTVPTEMFSNDPSLDSESNDIGEMETSPSNMGEDLSVDMTAD